MIDRRLAWVRADLKRMRYPRLAAASVLVLVLVLVLVVVLSLIRAAA